jgi:tRNA(Ile2) C34 agmatinyltransferase TiaS
MSLVALAEKPRQPALTDAHATGRPEQRLFEPGGVSLEDSIVVVWEGLASKGRAECPVCGGCMHAAGRCDGCGSELE